MQVSGFNNNYTNYSNNHNNRNSFKGDVSKKVEQIFLDLTKDVSQDTIKREGLTSPKESFNKLKTFVKSLSPDITFDYRKKYDGFYFKNKKNKKVLPAVSKEGPYRIPIHSDDRLQLQRPDIVPEDRVQYRPYHSEYVDNLKEHYLGSDIAWRGDTPEYPTRAPIRGMIMSAVQGMLSLRPVKKVYKYSHYHLKELNKYVDTLTTQYKPEEINKRLQ